VSEPITTAEEGDNMRVTDVRKEVMRMHAIGRQNESGRGIDVRGEMGLNPLIDV
jgi:hypothetical protein